MANQASAFQSQSNVWVRRLLIAGGVLLALLLIGALAFKVFQPIQVLPRIRLAPGFSFTDQDGKRLTNEDLRGKLVLYSFAYANCPESDCGPQQSVMQEVQSRLGEVDLNGVDLELVTISVDPERDDPAALKAYTDRIGADTSNWSFAGLRDPGLLKTIVGSGFEVYYKPEADGSIALDPVFVLVDGWGIIRGEYRYSTLSSDADRILRHIGVLVDEIQNSSGANRLAYEAAHLFLCYSP